MKFLRKLCRVVLCMAIVAVTLEVCARTEDKLRYGAPFFGDYSLDALYGYDALGKYGMPHASYMKWHLNALGYRGPELRDGRLRIVCLGSSETFGLGESPEQEWPRQLESKLNAAAGDRFEVINAAYPGLTIGTSLRRLPQVLADVQPRLAVVYPGYASYILDGHAQSWPQPLPPRGPMVQDKHFKLRMQGKVQALLKNSLPENVRQWMRWVAAKLTLRGKSAGMDRLPQQNIDAFSSDLTNMVAELQKNHVAVILVTHATRFGDTVDPGERHFLEDWRQYYPQLREEGFLDMEVRMRAAEADVAAAQHVPLVDAAHQIAPGRRNFIEFVHFTDEGADALSGLVAREVLREQTAPPQLSAQSALAQNASAGPAAGINAR